MADRDPGELHEAPSAARTAARFTISDMDRLTEAGLFDGPGGVELVEGELIRVNAKWLPHIATQDELLFILRQIFRDRSDVRVYSEITVQIDAQTVRETDVVVVRPQPRGTRRIAPADVLLAIEVADTTQRRDLGAKLDDYARAGVARVWIVDLQEELVHLCAEPGPGGYAHRPTARFGEALSLAPLAQAEIVIPVGGFE